MLYFQASKKIFSSPIQKHVLFFTNKDAAYHAETYAIYSSVAAEFKGKALFINVPSTENKLAKSMHSLHTHTLANALNIFCNRVAEYFGFSESDYPAMVIGDLQNESGGIKKFPYSGTVPQLTFYNIHTYIRYTLLYDEKTLEHCRGRESFRDFFLQRRIEGHLEK